MQRILLPTLAAIAVACAHAEPPLSEAELDPVAKRRREMFTLCTEPDRKWTENARRKILDAWDIPAFIKAGESVTLWLLLDDEGSPSAVKVIEASNPLFAQSARAAAYAAAPFGPREGLCFPSSSVYLHFCNPPKTDQSGCPHPAASK